jgi:diguanylate cyclase (GGDEF)-like protein
MADRSKILVVDDSRHMRDFFADTVLRPAGYTVLQAHDGSAGLAAALENQPDLIIADLQMPGLTGIELKRALSAAGNNTPLILVTAEGSETIASEASLAGVVSYLPKPVDVDVMLAAIEQALTVERLRRDRDEALSALEKRVHQLETLQGMGRALTASLDLGQVLSYVVESAVRLTAASGGQLFLLDERSGQLQLRAARGPADAGTQPLRQLSQDRLAAYVLQTNQPWLFPPAPPGVVKSGPLAHPALYVPLRSHEKMLGVLTVDNRDNQRPFSTADVGPLATLADYAAIGITNARLYAEVQLQSMTDGLTGIFNRRHFFVLAEREFQRAVRFGRPLSVIMLDIDDFKLVNDTHGHAVGDQVIVEVARLCRTSIRAVDILGRYGGEEFVFVLPETSASGARQLAERLRQRMADTPFNTSSGPVSCTASLGVASTAGEPEDVAALVANADAALYAAKAGGRNRVTVL